jgi:hypothetical protein
MRPWDVVYKWRKGKDSGSSLCCFVLQGMSADGAGTRAQVTVQLQTAPCMWLCTCSKPQYQGLAVAPEHPGAGCISTSLWCLSLSSSPPLPHTHPLRRWRIRWRLMALPRTAWGAAPGMRTASISTTALQHTWTLRTCRVGDAAGCGYQREHNGGGREPGCCVSGVQANHGAVAVYMLCGDVHACLCLHRVCLSCLRSLGCPYTHPSPPHLQAATARCWCWRWGSHLLAGST